MIKMRISKLVKAGILLVVVIIVTAFYQGTRPKLFVIGDSISIQYGPYLEQFLEGKMEYGRKQDDGGAAKDLSVPEGPNGGDSRMVLEYLKEKVNDPGFSPNYLLLNCGLHDIKRSTETGELQVNPDDYQKNLTHILDLLQARKVQVIWVRTTPVVDSIHNAKQTRFKRYAADLKDYNQIADKVMNDHMVPMIDLNSFTSKLGIEQFVDHVHFKDSARKLQAAYIAGFLQKCLLN